MGDAYRKLRRNVVEQAYHRKLHQNRAEPDYDVADQVLVAEDQEVEPAPVFLGLEDEKLQAYEIRDRGKPYVEHVGDEHRNANHNQAAQERKPQDKRHRIDRHVAGYERTVLALGGDEREVAVEDESHQHAQDIAAGRRKEVVSAE